MGRIRSVLAPLLLALAATSLGAAGCGKSPVDTPVRWHVDVKTAEASAKAQHKPLLVYFGAAWDMAAKQMEQKTFADPEVRFLMGQHFVVVHVDATDDESPELRELQSRFKVLGDPTTVIMSADGKAELVRFNEFVPPRRFANVLTRVAHVPTP